MSFSDVRVLVRGGGDLASGIIYRLFKAGFPVAVAELPDPVLVRRTVAYGEAIYAGQVEVEGVRACRAEHIPERFDAVPVFVDPHGELLRTFAPSVVVDARMVKHNIDTRINDAPLVIALGPGFEAGVDCHAVIETNRGHRLGRVYWQGMAEPDTGTPGPVQGKTHTRVLRAPRDGHVLPLAKIGDWLTEGQVIARMDEDAILAPFAGVLRGLVHERVWVRQGMKIGDLDPRPDVEACYTISDKSLAIGGGVLECILSAPQIRSLLRG